MSDSWQAAPTGMTSSRCLVNRKRRHQYPCTLHDTSPWAMTKCRNWGLEHAGTKRQRALGVEANYSGNLCLKFTKKWLAPESLRRVITLAAADLALTPGRSGQHNQHKQHQHRTVIPRHGPWPPDRYIFQNPSPGAGALQTWNLRSWLLATFLETLKEWTQHLQQTEVIVYVKTWKHIA